MAELMTVAELADALAQLCRDHPELADRNVFVPAECGYSGALIAKPFTAWVDMFEHSEHHVVLHSDDDNLDCIADREHYKMYYYSPESN